MMPGPGRAPANDFAALAPFLEQSLVLRREYADHFAPYDHIADPLIDAVDEGQTVAATRRLFAALRDALVPMARAIFEQTGETKDVLAGHFPRTRPDGLLPENSQPYRIRS